MGTNKKGFAKDFALEVNNMRMIKAILGNYFITKDVEADLKKGTDFLILQVQPFSVAVRLRRFKIYKNKEWRNQFTLRWSRPSGVKTEIHKIQEGLVDYILYGFVDESERKIIQWFLGDMEVFNQVAPAPVEVRPNNPRDSDFAAFDLNQLPGSFILDYYPKSLGVIIPP